MIKLKDLDIEERIKEQLVRTYLRIKCKTIEDEKLQHESSLNTPERK